MSKKKLPVVIENTRKFRGLDELIDLIYQTAEHIDCVAMGRDNTLEEADKWRVKTHRAFQEREKAQSNLRKALGRS